MYIPGKNITDIKTIFSLDVRSLALFRILLGLAVVLDVINRFSFVPAFYSDQGIVSRDTVDLESFEYAWHFQWMMLSGSEWFSYLFLGILLMCGILLMIGFKTRWVTFFCWLFLCSVIIRDPLTSHAGDTLLILLLFWAIFLPLGRCFSIDKYLSRQPAAGSKSVFSAASIALYVQISLMYITTGLFKAKSESWISGSHLYNTLSRFDYVEPLAFSIYPYYELLHFLTLFTLFLELFGPLLLFIPFFFVLSRMTAIFLFLGFQISIGLLMDVGLFPLVSSTGILVFIPAQIWDKLEDRIPLQLQTAAIDVVNRVKRFFRDQPGPAELANGSLSTQGTGKFVNLLTGLLIPYVILWNVAELYSKITLPDSIKMPGYFLKLDQSWRMFSTPINMAEYVTVQAEYEDGTMEDLIGDIRIEHQSSPDFHHVGYSNYRWRIFLSNRIVWDRYEEYQEPFIDYLVRNHRYPGGKRNAALKKVTLVSHWHTIGDYYDHSPVHRSAIYTKIFH